jgi:hypothetical protein
MNHSTLAEGLYTAKGNIAANATLSTSNLTADSSGGLNALYGNIIARLATVYGSSASPITNLADLPQGGGGYVHLDASISPTGTASSWAFEKFGTAARYIVKVTRIISSTTTPSNTYVGLMYDGTFKGWQQLALNSNLLALLSAGVSETFSNVDANDYKTGGTYYFATGCTNVPGTYFLCFVFQHRSDFSIQIGLRAAEKNKLYFRCFASNTWGNWNELALNANLKVHENQKEWTSASTTLSDICTYAENLVSGKSGMYYIGYTNSTASSAIGLPTGAYFVSLLKNNDNRM